MLWNYWGTTRFAAVPCSRPVAGSQAGMVPMGPLAARYAGFGTGHGNGVRAPIPDSDCAPAALLLGAVWSVADSSRHGLEACAWLLDDRMRASRRCTHRSLPDSRRPPPLGRLGQLDRCRVGQQFRNLRRSRHVHTCFDRAGDGGRLDCLPICACAQAEEPLAPGGVHTELFWVKRSTTVACLSWGMGPAHSRQQGGPRSGRGNSPFPGCRNEV